MKLILFPSEEVAIASIHLLEDLLVNHAFNEYFSRSMWECVWSSLEDISKFITRNYSNIHQTTLVTLTNSCSIIYGKLPVQFTLNDLRRVIRILCPLALSPTEHEYMSGGVNISNIIGITTNTASTIQDAILNVLKQFPTDSNIFLYVVEALLVYISYGIGFPLKNIVIFDDGKTMNKNGKISHSDTSTDNNNNNNSNNNNSNGEESKMNTEKTNSETEHIFPVMTSILNSPCKLHKEFLSFSEVSIDAVIDIFTRSTPIFRSKVFEATVKVLGASMMSKYNAYDHSLWRNSVNAFLEAVNIGLSDINCSKEINGIGLNLIWTELTDNIQSFLFYDDRGSIPYCSPEISQKDERIDFSLINLIAESMLSCASKVPLMHERLVDILLEGAISSIGTRDLLSCGSYKCLFALCAKGGMKSEDEFSCHLKIAQLVFPRLMCHCQEVLHQILIDEKKNGTLPLAQSRLMQVTTVLHELLLLELHPDVDMEKPVIPLYEGKKRHLLKLFPLLCDCITTREEKVKELLRMIFHTAAREIGLE